MNSIFLAPCCKHAMARADPTERRTMHGHASHASWRHVLANLAPARRGADPVRPPPPAEHLQVFSSISTSSTSRRIGSAARQRGVGAAAAGLVEVAAAQGAVQSEGRGSRHDQHPAGAGAASGGYQVRACAHHIGWIVLVERASPSQSCCQWTMCYNSAPCFNFLCQWAHQNLWFDHVPIAAGVRGAAHGRLHSHAIRQKVSRSLYAGTVGTQRMHARRLHLYRVRFAAVRWRRWRSGSCRRRTAASW